MTFAVVVAWHNPKQRDEFLEAWGIVARKSGGRLMPEFLFLEQDATQAGCAKTKNAGIARALESGADYVIVLDDDCYPAPGILGQPFVPDLNDFAAAHIAALRPQPVQMVIPTMLPHPRGMPYRNTTLKLPVAASMGFWLKHPDFDAATTLVLGPEAECRYARHPFYQRYFPFSGMNCAFPRKWAEQVSFVDCPRFDDIFFGWCFEKVAYEQGHCINLNGPLVTHSRQSNVWKNLQDEVKYLEINETIWQSIHHAPRGLTVLALQELFFGQGVSPELLSQKAAEKALYVRPEGITGPVSMRDLPQETKSSSEAESPAQA